MSFDNPTDSPMKRFSTFFLWLLLVAVFGLVALFFSPFLKDRDNKKDVNAAGRIEIKEQADAAQAGAKEKIENAFADTKGTLLSKPSKSAKAVPVAAPTEEAAVPAEEAAPVEESAPVAPVADAPKPKKAAPAKPKQSKKAKPAAAAPQTEEAKQAAEAKRAANQARRAAKKAAAEKAAAEPQQ